MGSRPADLQIATAPFVHQGQSTRRVMLEVVAGALVIAAVATWYFGLAAILLIVTAVIGACGTEWLLQPAPRKGLGSLRDGSALLTGLLLALTLPPSMPLWMALLGGVVGVGLGKVIWGGLGQNMFNPALVGRAFLQAAFPTAITTWTAPGQEFMKISSSTVAAPLLHGNVDIVTSATPLGMAKFEKHFMDLGPMLSGNTAGSLGETAAIALIVVGLVLGVRRIFDWRLPVSTLLTAAIFAGIVHLVAPESYPSPLFVLTSGGLLFGAVFMVTDPVTTPITPKGAWIYGVGVGLLVVLIRFWGGLPEGVMYAILLMNGVTPLINRATQPRRFGG
ncbi:MAG: hypothetical protein AMXMBFR64_51200 [Myxococcales bacterium]